MDGQTVAFVVFGGALVASGIKIVFMTVKVARSMNWARTTGTVLSSELRRYRSRPGELGGGSFGPHIVYEYTVMGQTYTGSTLSLIGMQACSNKSWGQRVLLRYPRGSKVTVHYDRDNPNDSCLENKTKMLNVYLGIFIAVLMMLAGLALMLFGARVISL